MSLLTSPGVIRRSLLSQEQAFNDADSTDASDYQEENANRRGNPYATCFGLPYQDHNYGAPPPPTPPASPIPQPPVPAVLAHMSSPTHGHSASSGATPGHAGPGTSSMNGHYMMDIEHVGGTQVVVTSQDDSNEGVPDVGLADEDDVDDSVTRCICDFLHDDGYMIQCDRCSVWQHVDCMGIDRAQIPDKYFCERCVPRKLNKQRAIQLQMKKRELLNIDTSATESENETKTVYMDSTSSPSPPRVKKKSKMLSDSNSGMFGKKQANKHQNRKKSTERQRKPVMNKKAPKVVKSPLKSTNRLRSPSMSERSDGMSESWHFADTYEEATGNFYSRGMLQYLSQRKINGLHQLSGHHQEPVELQDQLYTIAHYFNNKRGLEACESIEPGEPIAEYKGRVMLREQYNKENMFFKSHQPHVLFHCLDDIDLCVDASAFGNDVRHIRRSCTPNAEVQHFVDGSQLHFYVYALKKIPAGSEITIAYDYRYQECKYGVECACNRQACPVERFHKSIITNTEEIPLQVPTKAAKKQKRMPMSLEEPLSIDTSLSYPPPVKSPVVSPPPKRRRLSSQSQSRDKSTPATPMKEGGKSLASPRGMRSPIASPPAESDGESHEEPKPKMSREERKMEAIMKAFERMEKRAARMSTHRPSEDGPICETPKVASKKTSRSASSKDESRPKTNRKGKTKGTASKQVSEEIDPVDSEDDAMMEDKYDEVKEDPNVEEKIDQEDAKPTKIELSDQDDEIKVESDDDSNDACIQKEEKAIEDSGKIELTSVEEESKPEIKTEPCPESKDVVEDAEIKEDPKISDEETTPEVPTEVKVESGEADQKSEADSDDEPLANMAQVKTLDTKKKGKKKTKKSQATVEESDGSDEEPVVRETRASRSAKLMQDTKDPQPMEAKQNKGGKNNIKGKGRKKKAAATKNNNEANNVTVKASGLSLKEAKINITPLQFGDQDDKPKGAKGKKKGLKGAGKRKGKQSDNVSVSESADESQQGAQKNTGPLRVAFNFPKTKKHLVNEWLNERNGKEAEPVVANKQLEPLEISTASSQIVATPASSEVEANFVKCVPSPHTSALSHLRRSSVSSGNSQSRAVNSINYEQQQSSSMGSAKKRWLRQAMFERSTSSPAEKTEPPVVQNVSPPVNDFVTPLKKRRFTRELDGPSIASNTLPVSVTTPSVTPIVSPSSVALPNSLNTVSTDTNFGLNDGLASLQSTAIGSPHSTLISSPKYKASVSPRLLVASQLKESADVDAARSLLSLKQSPPAGSALTANLHGNGLLFPTSPKYNLSASSTKAEISRGILNVNSPCDSKLSDSWTNKYLRTNGELNSVSRTGADDLPLGVGLSSGSACIACRGAPQKCIQCRTESGADGVSPASVHSSLSARLGRSRSQRTSCDSGGSVETASSRNSYVPASLQHLTDSHTRAIQQRLNSIRSNDGELDYDPLNSSIDSSVSSECDRACSSSSANTRRAMYNTYFSDRPSFAKAHSSVNESEATVSQEDTENCVSLNRQRLQTNQADSSKDNEHMQSRTSDSGNVIDSQSINPLEERRRRFSGIGTAKDNLPHSSDSTSTREAEAKVTSRADASDLEDGELHEPTGEEVTSADQTSVHESEREEGELSSEDEQKVGEDDIIEPDTVHSSSGVSVSGASLVEIAQPADTESSEAEHATGASNTTDLIPTSYRQNCNSIDEVSSSRATDKLGPYMNRNWWRDEDLDKNTVSCSQQENSSSAISPRISQENSQVDSTFTSGQENAVTLPGSSFLVANNTHVDGGRSPIVSSTVARVAKSFPDRSMSVDSALVEPSAISPTGELSQGQMNASQPQSKKKMSLSDYRKRMKARPSSSSMESSSSSVSSTLSRSASNTPLYPTLPLFPRLVERHNQKAGAEALKAQADSAGSASATSLSGSTATSLLGSGLGVASGNSLVAKDDEKLAKWSATATMAEQLLERADQSEVRSLTERLRKEFGLEGLDDSDDKDESSDDEPPPPPPPPRTTEPALVAPDTPPSVSSVLQPQPVSTTAPQQPQQQATTTGTMLPPPHPPPAIVPGALYQIPPPQVLQSVPPPPTAQAVALSGVPMGVPPPPVTIASGVNVDGSALAHVQNLPTIIAPPSVPTSVALQGNIGGQIQATQSSGVVTPIVTSQQEEDDDEDDLPPPPPPPPPMPPKPLAMTGNLVTTAQNGLRPPPVVGPGGLLPASVTPDGLLMGPVVTQASLAPNLLAATSQICNNNTNSVHHPGAFHHIQPPNLPPPVLNPTQQQLNTRQLAANNVSSNLTQKLSESYSKHKVVNSGHLHNHSLPYSSSLLNNIKAKQLSPNPKGFNSLQTSRTKMNNNATRTTKDGLQKYSSLHNNTPSSSSLSKHHKQQISSSDYSAQRPTSNECSNKSSQTKVKSSLSSLSLTSNNTPSKALNITNINSTSTASPSFGEHKPRPECEYELNAYGVGRCFLCDVELTSQRQASEHLSGRKHIKKKFDWEESDPNKPEEGEIPERSNGDVSNNGPGLLPFSNSPLVSKLRMNNFNTGFTNVLHK